MHLLWGRTNAPDINEACLTNPINEVSGINEVHTHCLTNPINKVFPDINEVHAHCLFNLINEVFPVINEVHALCLNKSINEVLLSINEVHAPCHINPIKEVFPVINEVHAPCLTNFYNWKNIIDKDDWHVGFPGAQGLRVFVGTGTSLVEVEQSGVLVLEVEGTMTSVGGGARTTCPVSEDGCVSPVGDDGRVSPVGGVGCTSKGVVVLKGLSRVMLTQGLENEHSDFSPKFRVSLVEEVVPETLEEVAGAGVSWEGRVVSQRLNSGLKENDCACSSERLVEVNDLAGILVTNGVGRSLCLESSKAAGLGVEGTVLLDF